MVDPELPVADAAFRTISFVLVAASKEGRETGGLVLASELVMEMLRTFAQEADASDSAPVRLAAWTAIMRAISIDNCCAKASTHQCIPRSLSSHSFSPTQELCPLPFSKMLVALKEVRAADKLSLTHL